MLAGKLNSRATAMILEWAFQHRERLLENWDHMRAWEEPEMIPPLSQEGDFHVGTISV
ncbi:MAG: DUF4160 domain-containing protein [Candidatus Xenobiia bacterium LiM19]